MPALWFSQTAGSLNWEALFGKGFSIEAFYYSTLLLTAVLLDFAIGDPWSWPHPVQAMGKVIELYVKRALKQDYSPITMRLWGVGLAVLLIGGTAGISALLLWRLGKVSVLLRGCLEAVWLASCLAGRSLRASAEDVLEPLSVNDLPKARTRLARYVGRDTQSLSAADIRRAVLETVSENAIDGVLAPLFYAIVGACVGMAAPLALAYKAASTLDSMVGYRKAPYADLGWFSARLEDGLTWLPCRLSVLAIALLSRRPQQVMRLCWRDATADPSPNSGWSECAYAAALGVQLGGCNTYKGKVIEKPLLGDATKVIDQTVIFQALRLTRWSVLLGILVGMMCLSLRYLVLPSVIDYLGWSI